MYLFDARFEMGLLYGVKECNMRAVTSARREECAERQKSYVSTREEGRLAEENEVCNRGCDSTRRRETAVEM